jgi:hypothetical protein
MMMTNFENLIANHSQLNVVVSHCLPTKLGGLTIGHTILINHYREQREQYELLQEEIAHYDTSVGDITAENTLDKRKQEKKARSLAMERAVTLDGLIHCFYSGLWGPDEVADYFGVTEKYLFDALNHYRDKYGLIFRHGNYYFDLRQAINITQI